MLTNCQAAQTGSQAFLVFSPVFLAYFWLYFPLSGITLSDEMGCVALFPFAKQSGFVSQGCVGTKQSPSHLAGSRQSRLPRWQKTHGELCPGRLRAVPCPAPLGMGATCSAG